MHVLNTQYHWHCSSSESWSTTVKGSTAEYTVSWSRFGHKNRNVQYDYSCTCSGYKFSKTGTCKHIEQVKASGVHCNWQGFVDGGDPIWVGGVAHCPECGEQAHSMGHGV